MNYYFSQKIKGLDFDQTRTRVEEELKAEGFGVLTEIDIKETFRKKLDIDFPKYTILGACNPNFAHKALQAEGKIGVFLPCNVVIEELASGEIEVAIVDPVAMMSSVENEALQPFAEEVREKLKKVIQGLS